MDQRLVSQIQQIVAPVRPSGYKLFIFGSRARGTNRKFSDIDLGVEGKNRLSNEEYLTLTAFLEDSDLPYKVDVIDFSTVTSQFRKIAKQKIIEI